MATTISKWKNDGREVGFSIFSYKDIRGGKMLQRLYHQERPILSFDSPCQMSR
ncbi:MAG: hypothetical protein GY797_11265 [Deltaproteobacteria bacterium]|nr:hypothetical protein [Deltaproteobacteria bacterium]